MRERRPPAVMAAVLALILLFSLFLPVLEAEHDCCGEDCPVCEQIRACLQLLRDLLPALAAAGTAALLSVPVRGPGEGQVFARFETTLIALKVKLSD